MSGSRSKRVKTEKKKDSKKKDEQSFDLPEVVEPQPTPNVLTINDPDLMDIGYEVVSDKASLHRLRDLLASGADTAIGVDLEGTHLSRRGTISLVQACIWRQFLVLCRS